MGFSFNPKKLAKKVTKGMGDVVKNPTQSIKQIASDVGKGTVDLATLGQKKTVDSLTGGLASSVQGAYSGNSKDIVRVGATGGAYMAAGPLGAAAVNQGFASGGGFMAAAQNYLSQTGNPFANMFAPSAQSMGGDGFSLDSLFPSSGGDYSSGYDASSGQKKIPIWIYALGGLGLIGAIILAKRKK